MTSETCPACGQTVAPEHAAALRTALARSEERERRLEKRMWEFWGALRGIEASAGLSGGWWAEQVARAALSREPPCDDHRPDGPDPHPDCKCAEIDHLLSAAPSPAAPTPTTKEEET